MHLLDTPIHCAIGTDSSQYGMPEALTFGSQSSPISYSAFCVNINLI